MNVSKYQITLNSNESAILALNSLGLSVPEYIKFVARQAAISLSDSIPVFRASNKLELVTKKALSDYKSGKAKLLYEI